MKIQKLLDQNNRLFRIKMIQIVLCSNLKSDYFENNQFEEASPFSECFSGELKIKNKCKICESSFFTKSEFVSLNFDYFQNHQKAQIKKSRKNYHNLLSDEICSKRNGFLRSFERFQLGVFDYIYDFLHRDEIECQKRPSQQFKFQNQKNFCLLKNQEQELKDIFYCENCLMDVNAQKKYSIVNLPQLLMIGFNESKQNQKLPFKLEQKLNLSYFLNQEKEGESILFTQNIIEQNNTLKKSKNQDVPKEYLYDLECFVRQIYERGQSFFQINLRKDDKWVQISPFSYQEFQLEELDRFDDTKNTIVFCVYKKYQEISQKKITLQEKIANPKQMKLQYSVIPDNFLNRYNHIGEKTKFSTDFYFCKHNHLKPQFEDIFQKKLTSISYQVDTDLKNKIGPIIQNIGRNCGSYTIFNYLKYSNQVPKNIAEYFVENNYQTQRQIDLKQVTIKKCTDCETQMKKFTVERILHKALVMNLLLENKKIQNQKNFYVDIIWFNNYKLFLLADLKKDFNSKLFFNYRYITEKMNQNMNQYYDHFKPNYENDLAIAGSEFVAVNQRFYQVLQKVFGADYTIFLNQDQKLEFCQNEEMKNIIQEVNFSFEHKFIIKKLVKGIQNSDLLVYNQLIKLNKKINALLDFKLDTELKILNNKENSIPDSVLVQKKIQKIVKIFNNSTIDKIQFDPCEEIFGIFANHDQNLERKRKTYMVDRENSNKMKNKYGYRKTVIGINSYAESIFNKAKTFNNNFNNGRNFKKSLIASIDSNIKKQIQEKRQQSNNRSRISIFQEISQKVLDIANQSQKQKSIVQDEQHESKVCETFNQKSQMNDNEISNYTTSQIFSVDQHQFEDSLLACKKLEQSQQKTSILANMMGASMNTNKTKFSLFMNNINIDIVQEQRKSEDRLDKLELKGSFSSSELDSNSQQEDSEIFKSSKKSSYILESKEEFESVVIKNEYQDCQKDEFSEYQDSQKEEFSEYQDILVDKKLSLSQRLKESDLDIQEKNTLVTIMQNDNSFDDDWIEELEQPNLNDEDFSQYQVSIQMKRNSDSINNSAMKRSHFSQMRNSLQLNEKNNDQQKYTEQISALKKTQMKIDSRQYIKQLIKKSEGIYKKVKALNQVVKRKKIINKDQNDDSQTVYNEQDSINQDFDEAFNEQKQQIKHRQTCNYQKKVSNLLAQQNFGLYQSQTIKPAHQDVINKSFSSQNIDQLSNTKKECDKKQHLENPSVIQCYDEIVHQLLQQNSGLQIIEYYENMVQTLMQQYLFENEAAKAKIQATIKDNLKSLMKRALSEKKLDQQSSAIKSQKSNFATPKKKVLFSDFLYNSTPRKENQNPLSKFRLNKTELCKQKKDSTQIQLFQKISLDNKQFNNIQFRQ